MWRQRTRNRSISMNQPIGQPKKHLALVARIFMAEAAVDPFPEWIRRFVDQQPLELKPWIRCDGTGRYPYIEVEMEPNSPCT